MAVHDRLTPACPAIRSGRAANSAEPQAIAEALRNLRWEGTRGTIHFPQAGDLPVSSYRCFHVLLAEALVRPGAPKPQAGSLRTPAKREVLKLGRALSERLSQ